MSLQEGGGDIANNAFMPVIKDLKAVFIGGPGATKEYFFERDYLRNEIKQKVKDLFDIGYTDETGLRELVAKASESIKDMQISRERDLVNRFLQEIKKPDGGLAVYGEAAVRQALEAKALDTVLLSEGLNKRKYVYKCPACGSEKEFVKRPDEVPTCAADGSVMSLEREDDLVEIIYNLADASGARVEMISADSEEGTLLLRAFGGIAGILRYIPKESQMQSVQGQ